MKNIITIRDGAAEKIYKSESIKAPHKVAELLYGVHTYDYRSGLDWISTFTVEGRRVSIDLASEENLLRSARFVSRELYERQIAAIKSAESLEI